MRADGLDPKAGKLQDMAEDLVVAAIDLLRVGGRAQSRRSLSNDRRRSPQDRGRVMRDRPCRDDCNRSTCVPTKCDGGRIPFDELPCREFCQHWCKGCNKERCRNPYDRHDPRFWLGRGQESAPGRPFGYAHEMERAAIRAHLRRRIWKFGLDGMAAARLECRVVQIQQRLQRDYHRRKPPIGVRRTTIIGTPPAEFTRIELEHMLDLFLGANDPVTRGIANKIEAMLKRR